MTESPQDDPPLPPCAPSNDECCRGGCDPCVFDLYTEQLERYRIKLHQWEQRTGRKAPAA